ncbi:ATP-binding cassette domain-containing protein [Gordonibacter massiliensis (ex Traore et al. 2017)]|uniref:ATP-binding cassette domain-containing protein n=1 Tax=Gordonibacter massiliensis (ex Traore et al. 2017) TaxID=1841863 RepID=UPI0021B06F57|nr:ATP-binding cassette domain-containing protein [Gordonibacter massiliensis (ex Traore et al. 2017)]
MQDESQALRAAELDAVSEALLAAHDHERTSHADAQKHHHHTHAPVSHHEHGHHLLQVEDLSVGFRMYEEDAPFFRARQRVVEVIHRLSISVHVGEIVAVVGASGSGKTLLADAILGLFEPNATVTGRIWYDGELQDAASLAERRGNGISLVPQSVNHLDPLMKVGRQVEGFARTDVPHAERARHRERLFARYGLSEEAADLYPHQLSGGMARRVLLCCALMDDPRLIIADEPTPGLDLDLAVRALGDFRDFADAGGGVLLITHDIELALRVADRVAVFKDGTVVEETAVANFASPDTLEHPFSRELWHALPEHDFAVPPASPCEGGGGAQSFEQSSLRCGTRLVGDPASGELQGDSKSSECDGRLGEALEPAGAGGEVRVEAGGEKSGDQGRSRA